MGSPQDLRYTDDHEWARLEADGTITVGITDHAQDALGDVVFVDLPAVGRTVDAKGTFGVVESVKTVSDLYAPCAGEVVAVNGELSGAPEQVNKDPYGAGWIVRLRPTSAEPLAGLKTAAEYDAYLATL
ncbi:glycine cleavage system protein GcvH [Myxococcota bacterium]|jgi:glycine cleavage system H protein|nr:glycine cleavage system protein GcvH [Myxococcota bacterium]